MSYRVFALKWRPKNFDEIVGQDHIINILKNAIQKNRIANAYLFAGPRGVGKTSTARILAKALNCQNGPTVNPCQRCAHCIGISEGRNLDVIEIDGASNRGIDEIRALRENVKFAPAQSRFKIYIIDEVHMLTTEAFNALLKTLEEPPPFVKFIFATTQPHKVISTILSRCQRFDFRRISVMEIIMQLEKIIKTENIKVEKEVLYAIARSCDGSLRDAESILDQLAVLSEDNISVKDVVSVLGLVNQDVLFEITDKIAQKDAKSTVEIVNKVIDEGKDISVFLNNLIQHFRNLMVAKITQADTQLVDLPKEVCERLLKQSQLFSLEEIFSAFNILVNAQEMAKKLDSLRIPLEISLIKLTHEKKGSHINRTHHSSIEPDTQIEIKKPQRDTGESYNLADKQAYKTDTKDSNSNTQNQNANLKILSLEEINSSWRNLIEALSKIKMSVATYLNEGRPIEIKNNVLVVSFPKQYSLHKESLEQKENRMIIEKKLFEMFNTQVRAKFILSEEITPQDNSADNIFLKSALETFNGRIIKEF